MRFFTREWSELSAGADSGEAAAERVAEQYADHLANLWDGLPSTVRQFVDEVNLHDGRIQRVEHDGETRELVLEIRAGDEDDGFFDVTLRYRNAELDSAALALLTAAQSDPEREILSDELDATASARFAHRILFAPDGEVEITFETLRSVRTPVSPRKR